MARCIAHLSDLHFGAEDPSVVAALAADLALNPPDLLAVSGDLTQQARHREFIAAMTFLRTIPVPMLAVPGNHDMTPYDVIERFTDPYGRWRRHVGPETEPVFIDEEIAVVGLNTARRGGLYLNWARGRVSRSRLARAEAKLTALPEGRFRIVVAHHPFVAPALAPAARLVGNAAPALEAFARHGVGLVLTGHLHLGDIRPVGERGMLLVQAATATSVRLRGTPNAYNRITVQDGQARVTTRVWDGTAWQDAPAPVTAS
ncbi:metallophosphoesterase [Roseomonas stagni]|uniref:Metallophosphoesterase n=1 Tax=Falsiroseomonas algicola TaxID=2716930 RepID=A0A6M1LQX9_9PROT|nr:metallophosphoesterase [Falsiroseomonas algicola]NGM22815.1 metallophosphoesterase [Falsiroseomonas algicola]